MRIQSAISQFLQGYFSTCGRSEKTYNAYRCDLMQFSDHIARNLDLRSITPDMIEEWAGHLRRRNYSPNSIHRKLASLRVFFGYWLRRRKINRSPFEGIRLRLGKSQQLPKVLTEVEMTSLLGAAASAVEHENSGSSSSSLWYFLALRNQAILELMFATGLRVGEVVALEAKNFISSENSFRVDGKGGRQRLAYLSDDCSQTAVKRYICLRETKRLDTNALFTNRFNSPLSVQGIANTIATIAEAAGIERKVTPHMIRHTIATLLLRRGADIRVVQEFLGHSSIATTQRYTQVNKEHLCAVLRTFHPRASMS